MTNILVRNGLIGLLLTASAILIAAGLQEKILLPEIILPVILTLAGTTFLMRMLQKVRRKGDAVFIRYFLVLTVVKILGYLGISIILLLAFPIHPKPYLLTLLVSYLIYSASTIQWILAENVSEKNESDI